MTPVSQIGESERVSKGKRPEPGSEAGLGEQDRHLGQEFIGRSSRRMSLCVLPGLQFKGLIRGPGSVGERGKLMN